MVIGKLYRYDDPTFVTVSVWNNINRGDDVQLRRRVHHLKEDETFVLLATQIDKQAEQAGRYRTTHLKILTPNGKIGWVKNVVLERVIMVSS